ncbi:MAG: sensor histidine kinase [Ignavibacteria bacterium]|jgi:NtrC-family two-component system sensor histidine kinase KinB
MPSTPRAGRVDRIRIFRASVTKWQLKLLLTVLGLGIMGAVLYFTKQIVDQLASNERRTVELYARLLARSYEQASDEDLLFYVDLAYTSIHFPVILTDTKGQPVYPYQQFMMNVDMDTTLTVPQQKQWLLAEIEEMKQDYPAFEIKDPDGQVVQLMYYTNSAIVRQLRYMPFVEILIVASFILVGYVAFSTIRRNEESNIWVGLAKEAAHQLGTPLSSLLAWLELLRLNKDDPDQVVAMSNEMDQDVDRLKVIANRFAKIGSQPKLDPANVASVINHVCQYFETRLPNLGKKITLVRRVDDTIEARINVELFEWVVENLIKNAVEALERQDGVITIALQRRPRGKVCVTVTDNGKGMTRKVAKKIFQPGYTTKKRGWGLGLSLSKRIIEDYHGGSLVVRETQPGAGTTFAIEVPGT